MDLHAIEKMKARFESKFFQPICEHFWCDCQKGVGGGTSNQPVRILQSGNQIREHDAGICAKIAKRVNHAEPNVAPIVMCERCKCGYHQIWLKGQFAQRTRCGAGYPI